MPSAHSLQLIPRISRSSLIIATLDALSACPDAHALVQFHDDDGTILAAVRAWAGSRDLAVVRVKNECDGQAWTSYDVHVSDGFGIVVHDTATRLRQAVVTATGEEVSRG